MSFQQSIGGASASSFEWNVNGNISNDASVTFPLSAATGGVSVSLTVTFDNGCVSTFTDSYDPSELIPTIDYTATLLGCSDGMALYEFMFNDGEPLCITLQNLVWTINGDMFTGNPVTVSLPAPAFISDISVLATYSDGSIFGENVTLPPLNTGNDVTTSTIGISQTGAAECNGDVELTVDNPIPGVIYEWTDADGNILAMDVFSWSDREDSWWRRPQIALNSPIPRICRYESDPFWCNEKGVNTRVPNVLLEDINLTKFSEHVQPKAIICVPVHMPFGQIGAVSFSLKDLDKEDLSEEFEKFSHSLEILSRAFITGYVKVTDERNWIPKDCRLSKREVQCVSWAALGKTDKEIATILSRSCATVRFHLNNAAKKLDAVSRSQTVFKASQLGYLGSVAVG